MTGTGTNTVEIIASTLLQVGSRVLEVSKDCAITRVWDRNQNIPELRNIQNEVIVKTNCGVLNKCLEDGISCTTEHLVTSGEMTAKYNLRFVPIHPTPGCLFIVIEYVSSGDAAPIPEQYWEMALDAAGDGRWNVFVPEKRISFSDKWHSIFGYSKEKLFDIDQWVALIHPDDIESVQRTREEYFQGKTRFYHSEFRLLCENGNYKWVLSRGIVMARTEDGTPIRFSGTHTDINDRKIAEERYFAAAQMLSKLINNLQEGLLLIDENRKIIYANQMFCDLYDMQETSDKLIGKSSDSVINIVKERYTNPGHFYNSTLDVLNKRKFVMNDEWEMISGKVISRDFIPLHLGSDSKGGIWKTRDITAQKNVQKQLDELRNFYEQTLNSIGADIVVYDSQQRYLFINPTAIKNPELRQWMIGKTDEDYCKARNKSLDLVERRRKVFEKARDEKREIEWEETLVNKEGQTEYHLRYMYPVFDGNGNHLYGIGYGFNITDRIKAEQQLKTSMDTFASAFNESGIGMALVSTEGKWLDANAVLCTMTGYSKEELLNITLADITHPDDLDTDMPLVRKMLKGEISSYNIEKRYISRHNTIVQVLLTVSLVRDNEGEPKFYIAQVVDITRKKEMEWALNKKNADLEVTRENLLNKINQLEDLSHIIAHNLRGPAGSIKVVAETMLEHYKNDGEQQNEHTNPFTEEEAMLLIHEGSTSLMESLKTLMQITEIKLNKEIPRDNCNLTNVINDICNQMQSVIFEKKAIIHKNLDITLISYPKAYLENILYNLISNSLKYTRNGVQPVITITTTSKDGRVQLIIKDNGLGIDMKKYGHKVFRLNEIFHAGFDSKGVGLYITKTQVESFGGTITLESAPDEGCEFTVTL